MNILITSAGRRNQLLECFRQSAARLKLPLRILAADLNPEMSSACQSADACFKVPACGEDGYVDALIELCVREKVVLLVPTIDPELAPLSRAIDRFKKIGTTVVISDEATVALAGDKLATAQQLVAAGVPTPKSVRLADYLKTPATLSGPLIAKPLNGSSSVGIVFATGIDELKTLAADRYVVQERWVGEEFTVNMFFNSAGKWITAVPHERIQVRSGEVSKGRTCRHPQLLAIAQQIAGLLTGARGPLCFQAIVRPDGTLCVFEINARFGGGYPLAHQAGATFSQWLLEEVAGLPSTASNQWQEGVLMLRYDSAVFSQPRTS